MKTIHPYLSHQHFFQVKLLRLGFAALLLACTLPCFSQQKPSDVELLSTQPMTISDGCEQYISVSGTNSIMESKQFIIVKRGTYSYELKIAMHEQGAAGTIYSNLGERYNAGDELVFVNSENQRVSLRLGTVENTETQSIATFPLDADMIKWLAAAPMQVLYLKNNVKNQMLKFTINEERSAYFHETMQCFLGKMQ